MPDTAKPVIVITGASGRIGSTLIQALSEHYTLVGLGRSPAEGVDLNLEIDLGELASVEAAAAKVREQYGAHCATTRSMSG